jgi:hypothetical protein
MECGYAIVIYFVVSGINQIEYLEENHRRIPWFWLKDFEMGYLSYNKNYRVTMRIHDLDKTYTKHEAKNKTVFVECTMDPRILVYDYARMKEKCVVYQEELIQTCLHPSRMERYLSVYHYDIVCDEIYE